ncbi:hypothetical protein BGW42_006032 [Actinomortierella wolfii]|nr:hypothetical protein BGW42_006032 [Actinomortierella wolfii]
MITFTARVAANGAFARTCAKRMTSNARFMSNTSRSAAQETKAAASVSEQQAMDWNTYFAFRRTRRNYERAFMAPCALVGLGSAGYYFAQKEFDPTPIFGMEQVVVYGFATVLAGVVGLGLGPVVGNAVFRTVNSKARPVMDVMDKEFYKHIVKNRADPSANSVRNPVPDYYGEKIKSVSEYRAWLRKQREYRRKSQFFVAMLVASFLAGNVPLSFHLSEERLKVISNFGVGLLVGTSLIVIIPEGVETLYSVSKPHDHGHSSVSKRSVDLAGKASTAKSAAAESLVRGVLAERSANREAGIKRSDEPLVVFTDKAHPAYAVHSNPLYGKKPSTFADHLANTLLEETTSPLPAVEKRQSDNDKNNMDPTLMENDDKLKAGQQLRAEPDDDTLKAGDDSESAGNGHIPPLTDFQDEDEASEDGQGEGGQHDDDHEKEEEENDAHKYMGIALISGFILMFLIDQIGPTHAHGHSHHVSVADFTELHNLQLDDANIRMPSAIAVNNAKKRNNPITIGLVVHAAADGIALGASVSKPELQFIVFLAIMLHKAPAAFGLASVLLQHGFTRRQTRQQVAIFSLAAPIGAVLTYIFIQLSGHRDAASLHWWTGMLLLFSGGTFLYVAMHVMNELNRSDRSHGYVGSSGPEKGLSLGEVLSVIGGMIIPLILSVDHEH